MGEDLAVFTKLGLGVLPLLAFGIYKAWQMLKDDKRNDTQVNRIDDFYKKVQEQCEKLGARVDELQKIREDLSNQLSGVNAQLIIAKSEIEHFSTLMESSKNRQKYLEDLLDKNGIQYAKL